MNKTTGDYKESLQWRVWTITCCKENVPANNQLLCPAFI